MEESKETHGLDLTKVRAAFPMLSQYAGGKPLIYLDSAATTHKPKVVLDRVSAYYANEYAKPDEEHFFSKKTTQLVEESRKKMAAFIDAPSEKELIFTKGCTEGINIVANGFAQALLQPGDEIILTQAEHHANIVPWQIACQLTGAELKVAALTTDGELDRQSLEDLISERTKVISISHSSHVLGTIFPVAQIAEMAHRRDIALMVDGAQAAPHMPVSMKELGCDFYAFSGHKMGTPTGVGVLWGREEWLDRIAPLVGGGDMTDTVEWAECSYTKLPKKFEGGTQAFADIISTATLIDFLNEHDMERTSKYEQSLLHYATKKLQAIDRLLIYGTAKEKEPLVSFSLSGLDVKKLEKYLDEEWGIAMRAGALTAQPLMKWLGVEKLARVSFAFYNTYDEIDTLTEAIEAFIKKEG